MTDEEKIEEYIRKHGVTKCPPVVAQGAPTTEWTKRDARSRRAYFRGMSKKKETEE